LGKRGTPWVPAKAFSPLLVQPVQDTGPERKLRSALHRAGLRFVLRRRVGGKYKPDVLLPRFRLAIFVDGCWWHQCPRHTHWEPVGPNAERWREKFERIKWRDSEAAVAIKAEGFTVLRIWECQIRTDLDAVVKQVLKVCESVT
jgi:DNA mismatch endonuclease (patch repair protein)